MLSREIQSFAPLPRSHQRKSLSRPRCRELRLEVLERREVLDASLQVVHNSPYEAAQLVDVYVNGSIFLDDFAFRAATPFAKVPSGVDLDVDITAADAADNSSPVFSTRVNLQADKNYIAMAVGDPSVALGPTAFTISVSDLGRQSAVNPANVEFLVFHGVSDAPTVDVIARGVGTLVDDISFPAFAADYLSVPPAAYTIDLTLADGLTQVSSFAADLSGADGASIVVAASGFVATGPGGPNFGLLAVFADGTTALLPQVLPPSVAGTTGADKINVQLDPDNPTILRVKRGSETASFLTLTNPVVSIEGGNGSDRLTVRYSDQGGVLPTIYFDGGAGRDTVYVHGSRGHDDITLVETSDSAALSPNVLALNAVEKTTVWAGRGNDLVDASSLHAPNITIFGETGNDELIGGQAHDTIFGGGGDDILVGGAGNDRLFGGFGNDTHKGGPGRDYFFDVFGRNTFDGRPGWGWKWFYRSRP